ncbi:hypothetical protein EW146_g1515 [Bondarzewia mesenterica]|uniref:Uncharacterized protein n=1 Tax=Bondarzewia mesenterica TaxID=1095465 RepID=A0A4S4M402_9AGAM|nr:hypothetical protein EW146_g1515 [Bondarzewia mesenterica]
MATSISQLSASVTRILSLTGFPKELKTRDIQSAFSEWENSNGGFKIKWIDDTSLLIVFADALAAKRAYLHTLANPPAIFSSPTSESIATVRPYDGPDAQAIIQNVNSRGQHSSNASRGHNVRAASMSVANQRNRNGNQVNGNANGHAAAAEPQANGLAGPASPIGREGSPTLPSLPSHPTLDSLISSTLGDSVPPPDPAILSMGMHSSGMPSGAGPRIGDPGKRMLGAALGVRHPGLPPRQVGAGAGAPEHADHAMKEIQRAMGGLTVAE